MTTINQYNSSTGQWEPIIVGKQGPPGVAIQGTAPSNTNVLWVDTSVANSNIVPVGGTTNQVLTKASATNYDTTWTTPGLRLIKTVTVSPGAATVVVTNVFSSSWRNYLIVIDALTGSATADINMTVGSTNAGYYIYGYYNTGGSAGPISGGNIGYWFVGQSPSLASGRPQGGNIRVYNPNVATGTAIEGVTYGSRYWASFGGSLENTTQYTDFTFTPSTGTYSSGSVSVYGING